MLKYRWITSAKHEKAEAEPYYFSLASDLFDYVALEIYSADKTVFKGFLILSVSAKKGRTWVKILDFAFKNPKFRTISHRKPVCRTLAKILENGRKPDRKTATN